MNQMIHSGTACLAMLALASTVAYAADIDSNPTRDIASEVAASESSSEDASGQVLKKSPGQLRVAPLDHIEYPASRPTWLDDAPNLDTNPHTWVVVSGPCETLDDCEDLLQLDQRAAVATYIKLLANSEKFDFYPINSQWIEERLVSNRYSGRLSKGDAEMYEVAVELTFTPETQAEIMKAWKKITVSERLGAMGFSVFVGFVLLVCASLFLCAVSRRAERQQQVAV